MSMLRRFLVVSPSALMLLAVHPQRASALPPGDRTLFVWSGQIDREATIVIRGRAIETRGSRLDASFAPRLDVREEMPRLAGYVDVHVVDGRGTVEILQHPSARNDFTAVVNVRDTRGGRDTYRMVVSWRPVIDLPVRYDPREVNRGRNDDRDRERNDDGDRGRGNKGANNSMKRTMSWSGNVDDVVDIRIQGKRVDYRTRSGQPLLGSRLDVRGPGMPKKPVTVDVDVARGRGSVIVVQQPDRRNNFTTIIRIVDRRAGYGNYDFDVVWY